MPGMRLKWNASEDDDYDNEPGNEMSLRNKDISPAFSSTTTNKLKEVNLRKYFPQKF